MAFLQSLSHPRTSSRMDCLLHLRIYLYHPVIDIGMVAHQHFRIPGHCHKDCVNTTAQRSGEDVADLKANKERKCHNNWCEATIVIVRRLREHHVQVGQQRASKTDEGGAHAENRADQAPIDECVDAAVFDHPDDEVS